jgi:hypothetical protein
LNQATAPRPQAETADAVAVAGIPIATISAARNTSRLAREDKP